ncbi:alpha-amylase family glycosyl hydrolase [Pseudosporangium ferrugineum]|uniref:Maltose alpha-D-glucosyltransferase/alpha-amylase n=1 Tax=Pseudosporangium ferrugineum TaxID=439699 RepID=A0A2T0SEM8_9ACTN|nr:alpha-amylase family glycosyl hydrolase [Pseudosporangium ferrugineum]PRY31876.1 maltose alpha-D-glucosyltransferase/alpha-amylase [Pseudosporangium ferrugineum]
MGSDWLADAVLYEIYPQSFADSDGDGVGDLRGVIERLDHIASLGVDVIWFNPCFASPFVDAGYDVADYLTVAPRYGTNDDVAEVVAEARRRGIRVVLDLVAGHTSIEHPWFRRELAADGPAPDGDRYIWCEELPARSWTRDMPGTPAWVRSPGPRKGYYLKNFYDEQPALNFGWASRTGGETWRDAVDAPGPLRNRRALRDIIAFWLDKGVAGFRVDMAFSLVKDEDWADGLRETTALWRELREWLDEAYPDAVLIPEGTEPRTGGPLAFDADFFLVIKAEHASLFDNHAAGILPFQPPVEPFFDAEGRGSTRLFLDGWNAARRADPARPILMSTADHDFSRLHCGPRTPDQLGAALTFLFTWGSVPCLYYGDEIGMRYLPGMPDVEGAICNPSYNRAGCRTPMQWDDGPNAGFSTADASRLYLPIDPDPRRPTVAAQEDDPASTLSFVRRLIALRRATPALGARASIRVVHEGYPFTYVRGGSHLVVVNPRREPAEVSVPEAAGASPLLASGVKATPDGFRVDGFGYGILALPGH